MPSSNTGIRSSGGSLAAHEHGGDGGTGGPEHASPGRIMVPPGRMGPGRSLKRGANQFTEAGGAWMTGPEMAAARGGPGSTKRWRVGARPRTLPAAVVPVLVGTVAAHPLSPGLPTGYAALTHVVAPSLWDSTWWRALGALVVALALQVGTNYANDYSDGIRGTDDQRVGPVRLVASGLASPQAVKRAAMLAFGIAGGVGLGDLMVGAGGGCGLFGRRLVLHRGSPSLWLCRIRRAVRVRVLWPGGNGWHLLRPDAPTGRRIGAVGLRGRRSPGDGAADGQQPSGYRHRSDIGKADAGRPGRAPDRGLVVRRMCRGPVPRSAWLGAPGDHRGDRRSAPGLCLSATPCPAPGHRADSNRQWRRHRPSSPAGFGGYR